MMPAASDPTALFDRPAWRWHRERAARSGIADFLHVEIAERLIDRLADVGREFRAALDFGAHAGTLTRALRQRPGIDRVVAADPAIGFLQSCGGCRVVADPELAPFGDGSFDLVVSALALHWVGDLPGALVQLRRVLCGDGLFLAAMLGGATLAELRAALIEAESIEEGGASPRVSPMVDLGEAAALLQRAGFAMPVADADTITVSYPDILALMRDLRGMGETNAVAERQRSLARRGLLARAAARYPQQSDGRIEAGFQVIFLTGWAPHASQPKPLRPGSATTRLADALDSREHGTGETAAPGKR
jgi:SAM-dependent methyltransferase